jgi:hypothetical protein
MKDNADRLLLNYLLAGIGSSTVFIVFLALLYLAFLSEKTDMFLYFLVLLSGFLWIGVTSISRHLFVLLKRCIGKEIGVLEFLSTQFIVLLLPVLYLRLRREIRIWRDREAQREGTK